MSEVALKQLEEASNALIEALDQGDAASIENATTLFGAAVDGIRKIENWQKSSSVLEQLQSALDLAETARARVNYLTDLTRRRFELLCQTAGIAPPQIGYDRYARMRG